MIAFRSLRGPAAFRRDCRGTALVEFAIALPILLTLYLGGYALSDAYACSRKVTIATRAVADLTTQYSILSDSGIASILNASSQIMAPYSSANAKVLVTELYTDSKGITTVFWSKGINGAVEYVPGTVVTLPSGIASKSTYLILGEITYSYVPVVTFEGFGARTFSDSIYMSPRISSSVTKL